MSAGAAMAVCAPDDRLKPVPPRKYVLLRVRDKQPPPPEFEWTRSALLALAVPLCTRCLGLGIANPMRGPKPLPCQCVTRNIFRIVFNAFWQHRNDGGMVASTSMYSQKSGRPGVTAWSMPRQEFNADVLLIARRTLEPRDLKIFQMHFMVGAQWPECCRKLGMCRGDFFHGVYRIQQQLGRAFAETLPYPLFPLEGYFHG